MKGPISPARRLLWSTVVVTMLGSIVGIFGARLASRRIMTERLAVVLKGTVPAEARAACREGAAHSVTIDGGLVHHFYDIAGAALSEGAPAMDVQLRGRLEAGADTAGRFDSRAMESRVLVRLSDAGACAYAEIRWPARWATDSPGAFPLVGVVLLTALLFALAFGGLTTVLVVRPLLRSLDEKGRALEWILAELTHDIKTPLSSVQFALDEIAEEAGEEALPALRRALSDVVYIRSLTSNLRLAERIQARDGAALGSEPMDLAVVAQRVVTRAQPFALRRAIELRDEVPPSLEVVGDETAIEQALTNLLENAIAHCEPGTRVRIVVVRRDEGASLIVEDDGEGVVPENLPRLGGQAFRLAHERARDAKGSGLGLAITCAVCERSGWSIRFERNEPRGLRVVIDTWKRT